MSYQVNRFSSDSFDTGWPLLISDNLVNNTYGVNLLGRGVTNYGELIAENFVYLLENFAGINPPQNAVTGQIWFEADPGIPGAGTMRVYNGSAWVSIGGAVIGATLPSTGNDGDLFYRTGSGKNQLFGYSNSAWNRIAGLASSAGAPAPANDGDFWLDLSIPSNTAAAPNNKQRVLKVQVSGAWYPIALGDPAGTAAANNTSVSTNDNLIVFRSNNTVLGAWSNTVRTAPTELASVFPNGLQIGLNLSNVADNKIVSPQTGSNLVLGSSVLVQDDLSVVDRINGGRLAVSGVSDLTALNVAGTSTFNNTIIANNNATFNSNVTVSNGFIVESISATLTAAGANQGAATALTSQNIFINGGGANTGVILPTTTVMPVGAKIYIFNLTTSNKKIYPTVGANIDGSVANTAVDLGDGGTMVLIRRTSTDFRTINAIYG